MEREPWIGLVHVRACGEPSALGASKGAYVNIVALARNGGEYRSLVEAELAPDNMMVAEIEDLAPVRDYRAEDRISEVFDELIAQLGPDCPVLCDVFDSYSNDDS